MLKLEGQDRSSHLVEPMDRTANGVLVSLTKNGTAGTASVRTPMRTTPCTRAQPGNRTSSRPCDQRTAPRARGRRTSAREFRPRRGNNPACAGATVADLRVYDAGCSFWLLWPFVACRDGCGWSSSHRGRRSSVSDQAVEGLGIGVISPSIGSPRSDRRPLAVAVETKTRRYVQRRTRTRRVLYRTRVRDRGRGRAVARGHERGAALQCLRHRDDFPAWRSAGHVDGCHRGLRQTQECRVPRGGQRVAAAARREVGGVREVVGRVG